MTQTGTKFRWLKRSLLCLACVFTAFGLLIAYLRMFGGHVLQSSLSPESSVTAEVIDDSSSAAATDVGYLGVALKTRFNPIRHYVFGGSNYGAHVQVSWISDHVVLIQCERCEKLEGGSILERKWRQITICYDRSNVIETPKDVDASCPKDLRSTASFLHP